MIFEGWIDEVEGGTVWGRLMYEGYETEFKTPLLSVPEASRVALQPGAYILRRQWVHHAQRRDLDDARYGKRRQGGA